MSIFLAISLLGFPWDPPQMRAERMLQIAPSFVSYFPGYWKGVHDSLGGKGRDILVALQFR